MLMLTEFAHLDHAYGVRDPGCCHTPAAAGFLTPEALSK